MPLGFADCDGIDVYDIVSAGIRTTIESFARVKARFRGIERNQRAQKGVSEVRINIVLIAVDMNLHSCQSVRWGTGKERRTWL
jgi:hypothetical protein